MRIFGRRKHQHILIQTLCLSFLPGFPSTSRMTMCIRIFWTCYVYMKAYASEVWFRQLEVYKSDHLLSHATVKVYLPFDTLLTKLSAAYAKRQATCEVECLKISTFFADTVFNFLKESPYQSMHLALLLVLNLVGKECNIRCITVSSWQSK